MVASRPFHTAEDVKHSQEGGAAACSNQSAIQKTNKTNAVPGIEEIVKNAARKRKTAETPPPPPQE